MSHDLAKVAAVYSQELVATLADLEAWALRVRAFSDAHPYPDTEVADVIAEDAVLLSITIPRLRAVVRPGQ